MVETLACENSGAGHIGIGGSPPCHQTSVLYLCTIFAFYRALIMFLWLLETYTTTYPLMPVSAGVRIITTWSDNHLSNE